MLESRGFAAASAIVADAFAFFPPSARVPVDEWAAENRWLTNEGGGHIGLWDHTIAPYLAEPMRVLTNDLYSTVAVVGPGQSGKTEIANNWMLQSIDSDPGGMLRFMQTDDAIRAYVKERINPILEAHESIRAKQYPRPIDDSISFKRFRGMSVQFLSAARSNLISKSAPKIVLDEVDAFDEALGDVKVLADVRRQTYAGSKLLMISHPDRAAGLAPAKWEAGIMAVYRDSTRATWWWPCPHCAAWCSPNPGTARHCALAYPEDASLDDIARQAHLLCPVNGCVIDNASRRDMNRLGRWVSRGESIDQDGAVTGQRISTQVAGFWITGTMSAFIDNIGGIGALARNRVQAERADDEVALRDVMAKQWGIPFERARRHQQVDAAALADRAENDLALGVVPSGVRFLTGAVDVQANRFEFLIRGWGVAGESWVISTGQVKADPAIDSAAWDSLLSGLLERGFPLTDGSGRVMRLRALGFDSGGADGVTAQAYAAWRRALARRQARNLGTLSGRHVWNLLALKGAASPNAQNLSVAYPDTARRDKRTGLVGGEIPLGLFNVNRFKDDLSLHLARAEPGPLYVHIPHALVGIAPPGEFLEQLTAERRTKAGRWELAGAHARNEALDMMVMSHVMAHLHGLARLNWERPPAWASEWAKNPLVGLPGAKSAALPPTPAPPPMPAMVMPAAHSPALQRAARQTGRAYA